MSAFALKFQTSGSGKNDCRFDHRFSAPAKFGSVTIVVVDTGTNAGAGAGLQLLGSATAASSPSAIGTGDGFRELVGDREGNG